MVRIVKLVSTVALVATSIACTASAVGPGFDSGVSPADAPGIDTASSDAPGIDATTMLRADAALTCQRDGESVQEAQGELRIVQSDNGTPRMFSTPVEQATVIVSECVGGCPSYGNLFIEVAMAGAGGAQGCLRFAPLLLLDGAPSVGSVGSAVAQNLEYGCAPLAQRFRPPGGNESAVGVFEINEVAGNRLRVSFSGVTFVPADGVFAARGAATVSGTVVVPCYQYRQHR